MYLTFFLIRRHLSVMMSGKQRKRTNRILQMATRRKYIDVMSAGRAQYNSILVDVMNVRYIILIL